MSILKLFIRGSLLLHLVVWLVGCASSLDHVDLQPKTVGYQAPIPKAGTRVVVWGNHTMAVDNASMWLHQRGLVVLDRTRLQQGLNEKGVRLNGSSKDWANILEAGKRVGADLVAFVEVSNVKQGQKFTLSQVRSAPSFSLTVELRGVDPQTGEVKTKSKAWQTGPAEDPDFVIEELTSRALVGAWKSGPSEYKVLALDESLEMPQDKSMLLSANVDQQEAFANTKGTEETGVSLNSNEVGRDNNKNELSKLQQPNTVINANRASSQHNLENNSFGESLTTKRQRVLLQPGKSSQEVTSQKTSGATFPTQAELHDEIDSTYTDGMESTTKGESATEPNGDSVGSQLASGALSILYTPAKLVYAGLGGIFGSLAYVLTAGHEQTAQTIWSASLNGDYFLTPAHLRGDAPLQFMGSLDDKTVVGASETDDSYVAQTSESKR